MINLLLYQALVPSRFFFFQAEDGIRDSSVTGVQTCALPISRHDPLAYLQNRTVDWLDHQLAARELLSLDVANTHLVVEHEYPKARIQERDRLKPILQCSISFTRKIDEAAACMYTLQHDVLAAQEIPIQGVGREPYRS